MEVVLGPGEAPFSLQLPHAVLDYARGLLDDHLPFLGGIDHDGLDLSLAHHGISLVSETGIHEDVLDVPESHQGAVEVVLAHAVAVILAGHLYLVVVVIEDPAGVVQNDGHLGVAQGLFLVASREDDILHLRAPQGLEALFAHDPPYGVGDVALSAAVGAHYGGDAVIEVDGDLLAE